MEAVNRPLTSPWWATEEEIGRLPQASAANYVSLAVPEISGPVMGRSFGASVKSLGAFPDVASAIIVRAT